MSKSNYKEVVSLSELTLENFKEGETVLFFAILKEFQQKKTGTGKPYLVFDFEDKTGIVNNCKAWNHTSDDVDLKKGKLVKVIAEVDKYQDKLQLTLISKKIKGIDTLLIRETTPIDGKKIEEYIKSAPIDKDDLMNEVITVVEGFNDEPLKILCLRFLEENKEDLLLKPGGKVVHHAYRSGLLHHFILD